MNGKADAPTIRLLPTAHELEERVGDDRLPVVIDVLRACTTIACALDAGARDIIPVSSVEEAMRLGATLDRDSTLLCGERESVRIDGFDLGNSPAALTPRIVEGKTLVLLTTNGARALAAASRGRVALAASFVTLRASAVRAAASDRITLVCSGSAGRFSGEDFLCAGFLVEEILREADRGWVLDDGARAAREFAAGHRADLLSTVRSSDHGRALAALGFEEDIALACEVDRFPFVPVLRDGRLLAEPLGAAPPGR